jgi:hypothetical protein
MAAACSERAEGLPREQSAMHGGEGAVRRAQGGAPSVV